MRGRVLNATDGIPWRIVAFAGAQLEIPAPSVTPLGALYRRRSAMHKHQRLANVQLGFKNSIEPAQRQLIAYLRQIQRTTADAGELLALARYWLVEHQYRIPGGRHPPDLCRGMLLDRAAKLVHGQSNRQLNVLPSAASFASNGAGFHASP
jgi:hypothetical protein